MTEIPGSETAKPSTPGPQPHDGSRTWPAPESGPVGTPQAEPAGTAATPAPEQVAAPATPPAAPATPYATPSPYSPPAPQAAPAPQQPVAEAPTAPVAPYGQGAPQPQYGSAPASQAPAPHYGSAEGRPASEGYGRYSNGADQTTAPGSTVVAPAVPAAPAAYDQQLAQAPAGAPAFGAYGQAPAGPTGPGGPTGSPAPAQRPRRGGPGWLGVVAVGIAAAVVSAAASVGGAYYVFGRDDSGSSVSTSTSTDSDLGSSTNPLDGESTSGTATDWAKVAAAVEPAVVSVKVTLSDASEEGSGIIVSDKGYVLTNNHVVADAASSSGTISVVLYDGRAYDAKILGTDSSTDLAVIAIQNAPDDLTVATLGDSSKVTVGEGVMAIGNPLGLSDTVTTGIISATDRPVTTSSSSESDSYSSSTAETVVTNALQTDAAINPGNSGGALVNSSGEVIGVTSSIATLGTSYDSSSSSSGSIGLGFAIPINEAQRIAEELIANGSAEHAWLGVSLQDGTVTVDGASRVSADIADVTDDTPASDAGLEVGDSVIAVDDDYISGSDSLVAQIRSRTPGSVVTLKVVRDGSVKSIQVTLGTKPTSAE